MKIFNISLLAMKQFRLDARYNEAHNDILCKWVYLSKFDSQKYPPIELNLKYYYR